MWCVPHLWAFNPINETIMRTLYFSTAPMFLLAACATQTDAPISITNEITIEDSCCDCGDPCAEDSPCDDDDADADDADADDADADYDFDGGDEDFHMLLKAYQSMRAADFELFVSFFRDQNRNINASGQDGRSVLEIVREHHHGADYAQILETAGAN